MGRQLAHWAGDIPDSHPQSLHSGEETSSSHLAVGARFVALLYIVRLCLHRGTVCKVWWALTTEPFAIDPALWLLSPSFEFGEHRHLIWWRFSAGCDELASS